MHDIDERGGVGVGVLDGQSCAGRICSEDAVRDYKILMQTKSDLGREDPQDSMHA